MQVNAYAYDSNKRLYCMLRHADVRELLGDDQDEAARIEAELARTGEAACGGGAGPRVVFRAIKAGG